MLLKKKLSPKTFNLAAEQKNTIQISDHKCK